MGEDPIIVKPGVYPGAKDGEEDRVGICLVFDDDSWTITEDTNGRITITIPPDSRWKVVEDLNTPSPNDPSAPAKKKVALLRLKGILAGITLSGITLAGVNNPIDSDVRISFTVPAPVPAPVPPADA